MNKEEIIEFWLVVFVQFNSDSLIREKCALGYFAKPRTGDYNFLYFVYEDLTYIIT